jgi:hypothetical protein
MACLSAMKLCSFSVKVALLMGRDKVNLTTCVTVVVGSFQGEHLGPCSFLGGHWGL